MKQEKNVVPAPGGGVILRHQAESRNPLDFEAPAETPCADEIENHMTRYFGASKNVFHELISDKVHIDVHIIAPTAERNHWTLFTTGMSARPMTIPDGAEDYQYDYQYAELMISLPATWKVDAVGVDPPPADLERWYWPIRWLKKLARLPHDYKTFLGMLHTIPNGDPPRPFSPETKLCGWILIPPVSAGDEAQSVRLSDSRVVHFYCLHALHANEMKLKLKKGAGVLIDALTEANVSEVLDLARPSVAGNVAEKKKWWWPFS